MTIFHRILLRVIKLGRFFSSLRKWVAVYVQKPFYTRHQEESKQTEQTEPVFAPIESPPASPSFPDSNERIKETELPAPEPLSLDAIPGVSDLSGDMRDLLVCRMEDIQESSGNDIEHAGLIVDFLDEIALLLPGAASADTGVLTLLQERLQKELEQNGGELLFFDVWTPEYQRAVEVERCLPHDSPTNFHQHKAYGFKLNGKLIRKQEVSIQAPIP